MNQVATYLGNAVLAMLAVGYLYGFSLQAWMFASLPVRAIVLRLDRHEDWGPFTAPRWYDFAAAGLIFGGIALCIVRSFAG